MGKVRERFMKIPLLYLLFQLQQAVRCFSTYPHIHPLLLLFYHCLIRAKWPSSIVGQPYTLTPLFVFAYSRLVLSQVHEFGSFHIVPWTQIVSRGPNLCPKHSAYLGMC
jgi:hypothetical protein